ncbi:cytochrome P450 [Pestalotiopsis sp. NC0098]|nr:cytochrome P450 [Pestalotiopsis sp. NC0098]
MSSQKFYLVGDSSSTAKDIPAEPAWKLETLKKTVAQAFNVAVPAGITFHSLDSKNELDDTEAVLSCPEPVGMRIDGSAVAAPGGPEGLPIVGSFYEIFPDHLGNHWRLFRKYGHVIKTTNMGKTTYLTDSPEVAQVALMESPFFTKLINENHPLRGIKDNTAIFLGDTETDNWRLAHKFVPPAMGPKAVRHYTPLMQSCVRSSFKVFDEMDSRGEAWNVYQYMVKLASQTIGKFALGMDFGHMDGVDAPTHPLVSNIVNLLSLNKKVTTRGEWYKALPWGDAAKLKEVQRVTYGMLEEAIAKAPSAGGMDGLSLNDAALRASCVADYLNHAVDETGQHFPKGLVLSNMLVVTAAGYTTTSSMLSWMVYCLVTYPEIQDKLVQELVNYDVSNETTWTPDLAHSLPYLDKVIKEAQRLHNASFQPGRTTKQEVVLPGGFRLPKDSTVIPALYAIHTNPEVWRDPMRFDPDRWDTEEVKNRHRAAYIPFATGPRGCIGFNFALLEIKILLSELVYRYEFSREGMEAVEYDPEFQLIRPLNLYVTAQRRTSWPAKTSK